MRTLSSRWARRSLPCRRCSLDRTVRAVPCGGLVQTLLVRRTSMRAPAIGGLSGGAGPCLQRSPGSAAISKPSARRQTLELARHQSPVRRLASWCIADSSGAGRRGRRSAATRMGGMDPAPWVDGMALVHRRIGRCAVWATAGWHCCVCGTRNAGCASCRAGSDRGHLDAVREPDDHAMSRGAPFAGTERAAFNGGTTPTAPTMWAMSTYRLGRPRAILLHRQAGWLAESSAWSMRTLCELRRATEIR